MVFVILRARSPALLASDMLLHSQSTRASLSPCCRLSSTVHVCLCAEGPALCCVFSILLVQCPVAHTTKGTAYNLAAFPAANLLPPQICYVPCSSGSVTCLGLARTVYIYTVYDRILGHFPAKNTVYTSHVYGSGRSLTCFTQHRQKRQARSDQS